MTTGGTTEGGGQEPILDTRIFVSLRELLGERADSAIDKLLDAFSTHTPARLAEAREALDASDAAATAHAAHVIKGGSAQLGAMRLRGAAEKLESLARANDLDAARQQAAIVEEEYVTAVGELKAYIAGTS